MRAIHDSRVLRLETQSLLDLCEEINSVRALTVWLLAKYGEWEQYLDLSCEASHYDDHSSFSDDYLVTSIMAKNPRLPTSIDKREVAIRKWREAEAVCAETNARLSHFMSGTHPSVPSDVTSSLHYAREHIREVLGPLTRSKLQFMEDNCRFGPGATTSCSGDVTYGRKYSRRIYDATPRVVPFRMFGFPESWRENVQEIRLTECSKLTTVPKSAKTDRVICTEPDLNIFVQLGIGALIRRQLKRSGLDLNTQNWNQYLAKRGVELGLCTMDLSSASDMISRSVVWLLVDESWCDLLHFARVDKTRLGDEIISMEKWSSMGNGYTFELETLLFKGIVFGALRTLGLEETFVGIYGDDLIFPAEAQELVERTLAFLGFRVNRGKTFGTGRFRESCGTDWFDCHNVRPVYFRSNHHDFQTICYIYANRVREWAHRRSGELACDRRLFKVWHRCFKAVNRYDRHRIPRGFGDVGFVSNFEEARPSYRASRRGNGWSGYYFRYRRVVTTERTVDPSGYLISSLHMGSKDFSLGREALRGRFKRPVTQEGYSLEWPNLGPWL